MMQNLGAPRRRVRAKSALDLQPHLQLIETVLGGRLKLVLARLLVPALIELVNAHSFLVDPTSISAITSVEACLWCVVRWSGRMIADEVGTPAEIRINLPHGLRHVDTFASAVHVATRCCVQHPVWQLLVDTQLGTLL